MTLQERERINKMLRASNAYVTTLATLCSMQRIIQGKTEDLCIERDLIDEKLYKLQTEKTKVRNQIRKMEAQRRKKLFITLP